jgi:hypothetical protein
MRRFSAIAGLAIIAGLTPGSAIAGPAQNQTRASERPVLVCATDAATRRSFTREHGAAPQFITAREVLSIQRSDAGWSTPRCMTAREFARYREAATTFARAS